MDKMTDLQREHSAKLIRQWRRFIELYSKACETMERVMADGYYSQDDDAVMDSIGRAIQLNTFHPTAQPTSNTPPQV